MDYLEELFKLFMLTVLGWFWSDRKATLGKIEKLEAQVNEYATDIAVLEERISSVKEDTRFIRKHLGE
ncbi:MAG: hypothetical protein KUG81_09585 [Gammaproteobacteria bacterium]|nr:hypothetical protein [Gammaproteobacteria bacterium]